MGDHDDKDADWCMGEEGCQCKCCKFTELLSTPPRNGQAASSSSTTLLPNQATSTRPRCSSLICREFDFSPNDDDEWEDNNSNHAITKTPASTTSSCCPAQASNSSSPTTSDTEDDDDDEHADDRAVTPPNMYDQLAQFVIIAERLRLSLTSPTEHIAALALHHEFGGDAKPTVQPSTAKLLARASAEAKRQVGWSRQAFEGSLVGGTGWDKNHCYTCGSAETHFKTREGALLHFRSIHLQYKPYVCHHAASAGDGHECGQEFARRTDLRLHLIRKHENQRPFTCHVPFCGKGFASACELKRHLPQEHQPLLRALCGPQRINHDLFIPQLEVLEKL